MSPPHSLELDQTSSITLSNPPSPAGFYYRVDVDAGAMAHNLASGRLTPTSVPDLPSRPLTPGIYAPVVTFFLPNELEDIDHRTQYEHSIRLAKSGIAGLVTQGSNGEAVHMSRKERSEVTKITREALDSAGYHDMPIIVGCGAQSVRETIEHCIDAYNAGGDYAMILPPSYYSALYTKDSQFDFFTRVADQSPVPILIYNYPPAAGGIDLSSDTIIALSKHPKIVGCKLTCGNTGKLMRISASTGEDFYAMSGSCDVTLQALVVGGKGVIGGLANIAPRACTMVMKLHNENRNIEAKMMQAIVARGDWAAIQSGVVGTKSALNSFFKYGGYCRAPLPRPNTQEQEKLRKGFEELVLLERFLESGCREDAIHAEYQDTYPQLVELEEMLAKTA